jgi:hypothetical protein
VAVNDAARHAPWASALFSLDRVWMKKRTELIQQFAGEVYLAVADDFFKHETPVDNATYLLRKRSMVGLSTDPDKIFMGGGNSGFGALNLAVLKRPSQIILLGFDLKHPGYHWHNGYEWYKGRDGRDHSHMYRKWAQQFDHCPPQLRQLGIEVWNASL